MPFEGTVRCGIDFNVALSGLVQLKRAYAEHAAAQQHDSPGDGTRPV